MAESVGGESALGSPHRSTPLLERAFRNRLPSALVAGFALVGALLSLQMPGLARDVESLSHSAPRIAIPEGTTARSLARMARTLHL
jgi:hypothetical protein